VCLSTVDAMLALLLLEEAGMILLFFPTVGVAALVLKRAAVYEGSDKCVGLPIRAHFVAVGEFVRLAAIVLPVMSVKTCFAVVVIFFVRAPNCFKMVQIKICVNFVFFYHFNRKLRLVMCKRAKLLVLTLN